MTQTIYGHTYENFHAISDSNTSGTESNNTRTINMLSPYADADLYDASSEELVNWFNVNTEATQKYMCKHTNGTTNVGLSRDYKWNVTQAGDAGRSPLSRHYWTGSFKTNTSTNDTCFTYTDFGDGVQSDGFLHLLDAATVDSAEMFSGGRECLQSSISVNIQFNNLPAFTWVPLAGCTWRRNFPYIGTTYNKTYINGKTVSWQRDGWHDYGSSTINWNSGRPNYETYRTMINEIYGPGWSLPAGININTNNLYGDTISYARCFWRGLHSTYIMYCHDGNGKGMLANCVGMWPVSSNATSNWTHNSPSTQTCFRPQDAACNTYGGLSDKGGMMQWRAPHTLIDWFDNDTGTAETRLERLWTQYNGSREGLNIWSGTSVYTPNIDNNPRMDYGGVLDGANWSNARNALLRRMLPTVSGQLIAYGDMGTNADLSSPVTFYFNRHSVGGSVSSYKTYYTGSGYTNQNYIPSSSAFYEHRARRSAWFGTGKFGDLFFQNVPLYTFCIGHYQSNSFYDAEHADLQPGWVIQPTVVGQGQVNEFAITTYQPKYRNNNAVFSTTSTRTYNNYALCVPRADEVYQFAMLSGFSASYNPIRTAGGDNNRVEVAVGAWLNPLNAVDDDSSTITTCQSAGESNALYIKLEQSTETVAASAVVDNVSLNIYGLKVPVITQRSLKTRVTDSNKTDLLSGSDIRFGDYATGSGQVIPPGGVFQMTIAGDNSTTYADISAGYLKIFIE